MSVQEKGKKFIDILKKYGITEYWCDEDFDINEEHPFATIVIPKRDGKLASEIHFLYNNYDNEDTCLLHVWDADRSSQEFKRIIVGLQRRSVV